MAGFSFILKGFQIQLLSLFMEGKYLTSLFSGCEYDLQYRREHNPFHLKIIKGRKAINIIVFNTRGPRNPCLHLMEPQDSMEHSLGNTGLELCIVACHAIIKASMAVAINSFVFTVIEQSI